MVLRGDLMIRALTHFLRSSLHMQRNREQSSPQSSFHGSYSSSVNSVAISKITYSVPLQSPLGPSCWQRP